MERGVFGVPQLRHRPFGLCSALSGSVLEHQQVFWPDIFLSTSGEWSSEPNVICWHVRLVQSPSVWR